MKKFMTPMAISFSVLLSACSGDGFDFSQKNSGNTQIASTSNHDVYVPAGMDNISVGDQYFDGFVYGAGSNVGDADALTTKATYQSFSLPLNEAASESQPITLSARDMVAFVAEREALLEADAESVVSNIESALKSNVGGALSTILKQQLGSNNEVISAYLFETYSDTTATEIVNTLLGKVALGQDSSDSELDNPAKPLGSEISTRNFEIFIGVLFEPKDITVADSKDQVVMLGVVVPADVAKAYSGLSSSVASTSNVGAKGTSPKSSSKEVTIAQASNKADFLFVIDNSGSMSDDQATISSAADTFFNTISGSGTDFKIATITTDSSVLRDENSDGGFTTSEAEFKLDVKPGTGGSATETGIYFAEQALLKNGENGATADGSVIAASYPRSGASLSVIMFSDEPDYYSSVSGGATFDPLSNLFVDRNYQVYGIINPNYSSYNSAYIDLINSTNGTYADIGNLTALERIVEEIALQTAGASSQVKLDDSPIIASIQVTVNGSSVAKSSSNGWQFNERLKSFSFYGTAKLKAADVVKVSYQYMPVAN